MFFAILKKRSDGLDCFLNIFIVGNRSFFLCQTHVTLSTIMAALFTKILKEHTTATSIGGSGIVGNLVDALLKVRLTVFIHHRRKGDEFGVNTGYSVTHRRCLTMRNEIYDAVMMQVFQYLIDTLNRQPCQVGQVGFFNIDKVSEHAWIGAQNGLNDEVTFLVSLIDTL